MTTTHWKAVRLGESVEIVRGVTFSKNDRADTLGPGLIPCLRTSNIQTDIETHDLAYIPASLVKDPRRLVRNGDIIISMSNSQELVGKVAKATDQHIGYAFGAFLSAIRSSEFEPDFLFHLLRSQRIQRALRSTASQTVNIANLSLSGMARIELPLPPREEQRRVVAKLDSFFARSKSAREELGRVPKLVERYKQAVIDQAFSNAEAEASTFRTLGELSIQVRNGISRKPDGKNDGIPILKISAVRPMLVRLEEKRYLEPVAGEDLSSYLLASDDLLFTRYNGNPSLVANCGAIHHVDGPLVYPDKLIRVRVHREIVSAEFIELLVASSQVRKALSPFIKSAAGQHGISGSDLKKLSLPVPPITTQRRIVAEANAALTRVSRTVSEVDRASLLVDRLEGATLKRAFRGE